MNPGELASYLKRLHMADTYFISGYKKMAQLIYDYNLK